MKKIIAFCLALLLMIQTCIVCVSARASDPDVYTGTILAAINTNYDDFLQAFSAESVGGDQAAAAVQTQAEPPDELLDGAQEDDPVPLSAAEAAAKEAALGRNAADAAPKAEYRVGDRKNIYSSYHESFGSSRLNVECIYTNDLCTVWCEDGLEADAQKYINVAEQFCALLPREWEVFGDRRVDADGDGKIALFFQNLDSGVGGYFASGDLVDKYGRIGSVWVSYRGSGNACDCVHILAGSSFNTVLHEYQHYLHCSWKYAGKNNLTCIDNEHESYFNEGFSGCAEALLGTHDRSPGFSWAAADPQQYSMLNWSFNGASYTLSYVFCQYMRTRYALLTNDLDSDIPGSGFFRQILKTRSGKRVRNTLSIAADLLYPTAQYPDLKTSDSRCRALIRDFWLAVLYKNESGIHGFNGEAWSQNLTLTVTDLPGTGRRYLRSGMAAFCRIPSTDPRAAAGGSARVTGAGSEIRFVGAEVGRTLVLDPGDARLSVQTVFTLGDEAYLQYPEDACFIPGRSFLGWSAEPGSTAAEYTNYDSVTLSDARTTLYGVWQDAPVLTVLQPAVCPGYSDSCVRFTPETDGYYVFTTLRGNVVSAAADGQTLQPQWDDSTLSSGDKVCYALQAGKPVDLSFHCYSKRTGTLSVKRAAKQFTLTYSYTLDGETTQKTVGGNVTYSLRGMDGDVIRRALRNDLWFLGWAESPDAQSVTYEPLFRITLTADKTLYAVWRAIPALQVDTDTCVPDTDMFLNERSGMFTFTPQTDGTYRFNTAGDSAGFELKSFDVFDAEQNRLCEVPDVYEESGEIAFVTLQAGRKYRFHYVYSTGSETEPAAGACTLRMTKVADVPLTQIFFYISDKSGTLFDGRLFVLEHRYVYTMPDWLLGQQTLNATGRLVGWSADPADPDEPVYRAGDRIEPIRGVTLYPVLEPVPNSARPVANFAAFLWNNLLAILRLVKLFLFDGVR